LNLEYNLCFIYNKMDPQRQKLLDKIAVAINNSEPSSSLVQSLNDLALKVRDQNNNIEDLNMEFMSLTPAEGGRRHRGSKKMHKGKRHGNASLRAWVTFVKKVQREEKVSYKEAMSLAKKRKDRGEKWRGGGEGDGGEEKSSAENIEPTPVEDAMVNNEDGVINNGDGVINNEDGVINNGDGMINNEDQKIGLAALSDTYGGRRRRRTRRRRGSKKRRGTKKRRGSRRRRH
jgi:hypothetical protein